MRQIALQHEPLGGCVCGLAIGSVYACVLVYTGVLCVRQMYAQHM